MKMHRSGVGVLLLISCSVYGQIGGASMGGPDMIIHAPPPVRVGKELRLNAFTMEKKAPEFFINVGTSGRLGPYPLVSGTTIGTEKVSYTFHLNAEKDTFKLQAKDETLYGPFSTTNRSTFVINNMPMMFLHATPRITVTLNHPGRIGQMPNVGITPLNPYSVKALYELRTKVAGIVNRVNMDKSDREMVGVPQVRNSFTGTTFKPVYSVSDRDKQNAERSGEISTIAFLEKYFAQYCKIRPQALTGKQTYHLGVQLPGDYLLLVMQKVKPPANAAKGLGSPTAIWWTTFTFDGRSSFSGTLTPENAATWKTAFLFE